VKENEEWLRQGSLTTVDLPYFAQWESRELIRDILSGHIRARDDPLWARSGARTPGEYEFWSWRACGIACLRMMLAGTYGETPSMMELARELVDAGAYVPGSGGLRGLIYEPFAQFVGRRFGLRAQPVPQMTLDALLEKLGQGEVVVLASVSSAIRDSSTRPATRGGHLVLVLGASVGDVILHNPSGKGVHSQAFARVPMLRFEECFASRGITVTSGSRSHSRPASHPWQVFRESGASSSGLALELLTR
jgi:hypothetical protein